jgi:haloalkane dehalogenase
MTIPDDTAIIVQRHERHVETPHGRVYVTEIPGGDPPIVLMHGFPDDHRIYDKLLPRLSPRRAVAFDIVGYGRSDRKDGTHFSPEDHGAEITAVLDALGTDQAVLVGHDASGPDAVAYSIASPRRVARLVLLNTVFGNQPSLKLPEMTQLFADPQLTTLADDLVGEPNQLLWLLQRWGVQWELDASDPEGIARNSILPQFYGDEHQPDAVASVRAWCAGLHDTLDQQDAMPAAEPSATCTSRSRSSGGKRTSTSARHSPPKSRRCSRTHRSISCPAPGTGRNTTSPTQSPSS